MAVAGNVWMWTLQLEAAVLGLVRLRLTPDHQKEFFSAPSHLLGQYLLERRGRASFAGALVFSHVGHAIFILFILACWAPRR